mmetsp:Transcript_82476/g.163743  ORF Transcript_82476/g.163743 Transcript_82476/m.163743 type:complete len:500 (-) Transcript_82476:195-1694(-)
MATARGGGGLHVIRNVEAGLQSQLADHRAELQDHVDETSRLSEESSLRRAEALLGPPLAAQKERLDRELPALQLSTERQFGESRHEMRALRAELSAEAAQLRSELSKLQGELPDLSEGIRKNAAAIAEFEGTRRELWLASDSVRNSVREAVESFEAQMTKKAEDAAHAVQLEWCPQLHENMRALDATVQLVDTQCRQESANAMSAAKTVQDLLECRIDELRLQSKQYTQQHAAEVSAKLREDVLEFGIVRQFQQRLHESTVTLESRIANHRAELLTQIKDVASSTLSRAERNSEDRTSTLATQVHEVVLATRKELETQARTHADAVEQLGAQIQDAKTNFDAADLLTRNSLDNIRTRAERLQSELITLHGGLGDAKRTALDDVAAVRAEVQNASVRWKNFEEVGMPALLAQVERRTGDSEARSVTAALDYAERLRRLPAPMQFPTKSSKTNVLLPGTTNAPQRQQHASLQPELSMAKPLPPISPRSTRVGSTAPRSVLD